MRPIVNGYLLTHSLEQLEADHGVCARMSSDMSKLSLNYDHIMSKKGDRALSSQCRGLVVRPLVPLTVDNWRSRVVGEVNVLAWPMDRFYNAGDSEAAKINWSDSGLLTTEKLDGTCCILYWDSLRNDWCVATRSVCEADLPIEPPDDVTLPPVPHSPMTFASLFWHAVRETTRITRDAWTSHLLHNRTYVFELTTPWNKVVIRHPNSRVHLLAVRDLSTGHEVDPYANGADEVRLVANAPVWDSYSLDALVAFVNMKNPTQCEGAVVRDSKMNRIKIKHAGYAMSSRINDALRVSKYEIVRQIILDKADDIAAALSGDTADKFNAVVMGVEKYFAHVDATFARLKSLPTRKDFAKAVMALNELYGPYFAMWDGGVTSAAGWARDLAKRNLLTRSALDYIVSRLE